MVQDMGGPQNNGESNGKENGKHNGNSQYRGLQGLWQHYGFFGVFPILGAYHTENATRGRHFDSSLHDWLLAMGAGYYSHTIHLP